MTRRFVLALLVLLALSFAASTAMPLDNAAELTANTAAVERRGLVERSPNNDDDDFVERLCGGFRFVYPSKTAGRVQRRDKRTHVTIDFGKSQVRVIEAIELFTTKGLYGQLYSSKRRLSAHGRHVVHFRLRTDNKPIKSGKYLYRAWGGTDAGPDCTTYSETFRIRH